ncbi:phosphodiesterase [Paroceanicella profunda]|uniref:Phosphodiesterase n=1 Tax=Paroceanicella profunda TaxID=2579971 RepID=A0A5B8FXW1_9RHOB|nr:phosphodiesterase [Paroceanicella profunda]QDL92130.1 phosphodiesterase [Paroceanicella profunda]
MLIAQISDPHMRAAGQLYQGLVDSNTMCAAAIATLNALDPQPDLVLLSGDVVDTGTPADYAQARHVLDRLRAPLLAIPGNHDAPEGFRRCFAGQPGLAASGPLHVDWSGDGPLRVLGLDITVPGAHHGRFDAAAEDWLARALARAPDRPVLLMMHQPPCDIGIGCIDAYRCFGEDRLAALLARHPRVQRVLCGHVHRLTMRAFGGTLLLTAPSTTTAIALRLAPGAEPASHVEPPALLLHHWREGAGLTTHHLPIGAHPGPFPFF